MRLTLVFAFIILQCAVQICGKEENEKPKILVFGGNGFMGSETVTSLLETGKYDITLVNRGNYYWDSNPRVGTASNKTRSFKCDRSEGMEKCDKFVLWAQGQTFLAVLDFSGYRPSYVKDSLDLLRSRTTRYIYVSTDNIYDVCEKKHSNPTNEEDATRPEDEDKMEELANESEYGNFKLACEEEIVESQKESDFSYIIIRLPDVIGPRDNSQRWWVYQMWLRMRNFLGASIMIQSKVKDTRQSLVYVSDVARLLTQLVDAPDEVYNQVYNLAFDRNFTAGEIVTSIADELGIKDSKEEPLVQYSDQEYVPVFYPTVKRGPLDISRLKRVLKFEPTPWEKAVKETVAFYEDVMKNGGPHEDSRNRFLFQMSTHLRPEAVKRYMEGLKQVYDINAQTGQKPEGEKEEKKESAEKDKKEEKKDSAEKDKKEEL